MKLKIRYIRVHFHNQYHLEHLLNLYAQQGWYLKYKIKSFLVLEYDPHREKGITILFDGSKGTKQEKQFFERHLVDLEEFGYTQALVSGGFVFMERPVDGVYVSDQSVDAQLNLPKRKKVQQQVIADIWTHFIVITSVTILFESGRRSLAAMVFTNPSLVFLGLLILYYFGIIGFGIWKILRIREYVRALDKPLPKSFRSTRQTLKDNLQLLNVVGSSLLLVMLAIMLFVETNNYTPFLIMLAVLLLFGSMYLIFVYFNDKASVQRKIGLLVIGACALVGFFYINKLSIDFGEPQERSIAQSIIPLESIDTLIETNQCSIIQQHESWVARFVRVGCDDYFLEVTQARNIHFLQLISFAQTGYRMIDEHTITPVVVLGAFNGTAYRKQTVIVVSSRALPSLVLEELSSE